MKTSRPFNFLALILSLILLDEIAFAQPGSWYPPPSSIDYQTDTLIIFPPDSLPGAPVELLSYNIYVDNEFYGYAQVSDPEEAVHYFLDDESLLPGNRIFCATAVYNEWISVHTCDTAMIIYGYELPFYEDWLSGSFETLQWTTDSDHWIINSFDGNPAPSVSFQGEPGLTNYEAVLESYPINAIGLTIGLIWLNFDIKFQAVNQTNEEILRVQVWSSTYQSWTTVKEYNNGEGSFDWKWGHINIRSQAINKVFRIRFVATGENSEDIAGWYLDNIKVYRHCEPPTDLELIETIQYNKLTWFASSSSPPNQWIHWDDGENAANSIGTGQAIEFDVAARWDSEQLTAYFGQPFTLSQIAFFPAENEATYNLRVWIGSDPDTFILDQVVESPVINQWNYESLDNPIEIDTNSDLWIGYHISTPTGYPAGVDDGPAINGYGNMMFLDGTWSTLLEINEDLDFNWNIAGYIYFSTNPEKPFLIYRKKNDEGFEFYAETNNWEYVDLNIVFSDYYCYRVTEIWADDSDTCESEPTSTVCEVLIQVPEQKENEGNIQVFPNPVKDFLTIESPDRINEVRIYSMLGECVLKLEIGNLEGRVDVRGMSEGMYCIEVITDKVNYKDKILILR